MLRNALILALIAFLLSCSCDEESPNLYFMDFKLRGSDGELSAIRVLLENTEPMNGNSILDSDQASIGLHISALFENPDDRTISQSIHFMWSREIPKNEVTFASNGIPTLRYPEKMREYLPRTNLFEEQSTSFFSYFIENIHSFCSAGIDHGYENTFRIMDVRQYIDDNNNEAIDITAEFSVRYTSICNLGDKEISEGVLRAKILL